MEVQVCVVIVDDVRAAIRFLQRHRRVRERRAHLTGLVLPAARRVAYQRDAHIALFPAGLARIQHHVVDEVIAFAGLQEAVPPVQALDGVARRDADAAETVPVVGIGGQPHLDRDRRAVVVGVLVLGLIHDGQAAEHGRALARGQAVRRG